MVRVEKITAENTFKALMDLAQAGEEVMITSNGEPVLRLTQILSAARRKAAREASDQLREIAKELPKEPFDWEERKADLGRR